MDLSILPLENLVHGVKAELEHGKRSPRTNVTNDDLVMTVKIALAHFEEAGPTYYKELDKLEKKLSKWKNRSIFI